MRRILVVVAVLALFLLPTAGASADPPENPFRGPWIGMDPPPDSSNNSLRVGGGNNHAVYQEDGLTACNTFDEEMTRHRGYLSGFATIENGTLTLTGTLWCIVPGMGRVPSERLPVVTLVFTDNGDGTLDFDGVCYHRPGTPPC